MNDNIFVYESQEIAILTDIKNKEKNKWLILLIAYTKEKDRLEKEIGEEVIIKYGCSLEDVTLPKGII